jgi:hypothetical protein
MRALGAQELLELWEHGRGRSRSQRAVDLLVAADAGASPDDVRRLTVGRRDDALLTLREWTFGPALHAVATCDGCGAELELDLCTDDVRVPGAHGEPDAEIVVRAGGATVAVRPPTSADLLAAEQAQDAATARATLLRRCARRTDGAGAVPPAADGDVAAAMASADPQADVVVAIACPECDASAALPFDVASFFWRELEAWAQRLVREVAALARAYGWTEPDVLALSAGRRRLYLEAAGW